MTRRWLIYSFACVIGFAHSVSSRCQISFDVASGTVVRVDGKNLLANAAGSKPPSALGSATVVGVEPFATSTRGSYEQTGVTMPVNVSLPIGHEVSTARGVTIRIVLKTATPSGADVSSTLSLREQRRGLVMQLGHTDQAWSVGRSVNASPLNSILKNAKFLWMTPWDPIYDKPDTTVILYARIRPTGVVHLDRFVPYYDPANQLKVSWEEGVQEGWLPSGEVGVGQSKANPPAPLEYRFDQIALGQLVADEHRTGSAASDVIRNVSIASIEADERQMLEDVGSLVPGLKDRLGKPDLRPCNTGNWQVSNTYPNEQFTTVCGDLQTYPPDAGGGLHYGPPSDRTQFVTGRTGLFAPPLVQNTHLVGDIGQLRVEWDPTSAASGYNYQIYRGSNSITEMIAGGTTSSTFVRVPAVADTSYTVFVSPFNAMGVGPNQPVTVTALPSSPVNLIASNGYYSGWFTWEEPKSPGVSPVLYYRVSVDGKEVGTAYGTQWGVDGLSVSSEHSVTVKAVNKFGEGAPATATFRTADKGPVPPTVQNYDGTKQTVRFCADQHFNCLISGDSVLVAYGAVINGVQFFYYKLFDSFSSRLVPPCTAAAFGLPAPPPDQRIPNACFVVAEAGADENGLLDAPFPGASFCAFEYRGFYDKNSGTPHNCGIPSKRGVVAFGEGSKWTVELQSDTVQCSDSVFVDPSPNRAKRCYYYYPNDPTALNMRFCASEGQQCSGSGPSVVAFGVDYLFVYKTVPNGSVACISASFNLDPRPGKQKGCFIADLANMPTPPVNHTFCALGSPTAGSLCLTPLPDGLFQVRFGSQGKTVPRSTPAGYVECSIPFFPGSAPANGQPTACFYGLARSGDEDTF